MLAIGVAVFPAPRMPSGGIPDRMNSSAVPKPVAPELAREILDAVLLTAGGTTIDPIRSARSSRPASQDSIAVDVIR
jgi:hypothetical protein